MENQITECPYCKCEVEPTNDKTFVNGVKPVTTNFILGEGCEFCCPEPTQYGVYLNGEGLDSIESYSREEALKTYRAKEGANQSNLIWVEELNA